MRRNVADGTTRTMAIRPLIGAMTMRTAAAMRTTVETGIAAAMRTGVATRTAAVMGKRDDRTTRRTRSGSMTTRLDAAVVVAVMRMTSTNKYNPSQ